MQRLARVGLRLAACSTALSLSLLNTLLRLLTSWPCYYYLFQGVDLIAGGRSKKVHRTAPKSDNVYLKLLVKVSC